MLLYGERRVVKSQGYNTSSIPQVKRSPPSFVTSSFSPHSLLGLELHTRRIGTPSAPHVAGVLLGLEACSTTREALFFVSPGVWFGCESDSSTKIQILNDLSPESRHGQPTR